MATSKAKVLMQMILRAMEERLGVYGFIANKREGCLVRELTGRRGRSYLSIGSRRIGNELDFMGTVCLRFDEVEELVHECEPDLTPRDRAATCTLGSDLGNIANNTPQYAVVAGEADVAAAAQKLVSVFLAFGLPVVDRLTDPSAALAVLARDDRESRMYSPTPYARAMRACALLHVLGRTGEVAELGARMMEWLTRSDAFRKERLADLLSRLAVGG